jgi:hypothetical protein
MALLPYGPRRSLARRTVLHGSTWIVHVGRAVYLGLVGVFVIIGVAARPDDDRTA